METGWCSYGDNCHFSHPQIPQFNHLPDGYHSQLQLSSESSQSSHSHHSRQTKPSPKKKIKKKRKNILCRYWADNGHCKRGNRCRFIHGPAEKEHDFAASHQSSIQDVQVPIEFTRQYTQIFEPVIQQQCESPKSSIEYLVNQLIQSPPTVIPFLPHQEEKSTETVATISCPNAPWRESTEISKMKVVKELEKEIKEVGGDNFAAMMVDRMMKMEKYQYKCSYWDDECQCCTLENKCEEHAAYRKWLQQKVLEDEVEKKPKPLLGSQGDIWRDQRIATGGSVIEPVVDWKL